jgi:ribonuclease HI
MDFYYLNLNPWTNSKLYKTLSDKLFDVDDAVVTWIKGNHTELNHNADGISNRTIRRYDPKNRRITR